jgi:hypothetical protein
MLEIAQIQTRKRIISDDRFQITTHRRFYFRFNFRFNVANSLQNLSIGPGSN